MWVTSLKTKHKKKNKLDTKCLRFRLTLAFIVFAIVIMGCLWLLQTFFLEDYYENSMEKKAAGSIKLVTAAYSLPEVFDSQKFYDMLAIASSENDLYFYIESPDGKTAISSTELTSGGRVVNGVALLITEARQTLGTSQASEVSFIKDYGTGGKMLIKAAKIESKYREPIFLYVIAPLTPLGTTVDILASQLFWVTMLSLLLAGIIALIYSKMMSRPLTDLGRKAQLLAKGDYDIEFNTKKGYTEIRQLAQTLNETVDELEKSNTLQKDLLANVSHDLRTPLTMIKSYAELVRDISGDDKERRDEHLGVIVEETDRLSKLVGDILLLSKMQSGTLELEHKPFDIQKAAESVLQVYRVLEDQDGFRFNFVTVGGNAPIVTGDESKIQQVFANLISNAVRYSEDNREITLRFEKLEGRLKCSVSDHGCGIPPEDLENIWNRYQRASGMATRAHASGTGLGLSIAKEILEHHGADYGVESTMGEGSCFWFVIDANFDIDSIASL